ncbi:MAG: C1 family peptidase [Candidatus Eremiobacteraeota bacterium]|nr:C1 family peptidase [Candidatus Eremiobacteraeota bacterium]
MMHSMRRIRFLGAFLAAVMLLGSCSGSDRGKPQPTASAQAAGQHHRFAVLQRLRGFLKNHHYTFKIGLTSVLGVPIASVTGAIRERIRERERASEPQPETASARSIALRASYDARVHHLISPVEDQGHCGTCAVFAVVGLLETATAVARHEKVRASEQDLMNCYPDDCKGDVRTSRLLRYLKNSGTGSRDEFQYQKTLQPCSKKALRCYRLKAYGFVDSQNEVPTRNALKLGIATYGALASWMFATPLFEAYTGDAVFYENVDRTLFDGADSKAGGGHEVLLVGWDDDRPYANGKHGAWLIKNSWGTDWGDRGFAWIAYGSNGIGTDAQWATVSPERAPGCTL